MARQCAKPIGKFPVRKSRVRVVFPTKLSAQMDAGVNPSGSSWRHTFTFYEFNGFGKHSMTHKMSDDHIWVNGNWEVQEIFVFGQFLLKIFNFLILQYFKKIHFITFMAFECLDWIIKNRMG